MKFWKNWKILWSIILLLLIFVGVLLYSLTKTKYAVVQDFESCAKLYPVLESYPAQCITPDGRHFTQIISEKDAVFCTQEAKECPDGSFVGRVGPKCEFAPCP